MKLFKSMIMLIMFVLVAFCANGCYDATPTADQVQAKATEQALKEADTQIGMPAPTFKCISMAGDSIDFKNYNGKFLMLANVSACYSKVSSYKCYKDLTNAYKEKIEILCLDKSPVFLKNNIKELNLSGKFIDVNKNEELKKYRPDFCSRTCYLINPEGRIVDKFEIFDWKKTLAKHFN